MTVDRNRCRTMKFTTQARYIYILECIYTYVNILEHMDVYTYIYKHVQHIYLYLTPHSSIYTLSGKFAQDLQVDSR